jgi:hypothetical protein
MEVEIYRCKYLLPCGRCEKRGAPCDAPKTNCNHNWIIEVTKSDYIDGYGNECCVVHQHCSKCGMTDVRIQPLKT